MVGGLTVRLRPFSSEKAWFRPRAGAGNVKKIITESKEESSSSNSKTAIKSIKSVIVTENWIPNPSEKHCQWYQEYYLPYLKRHHNFSSKNECKNLYLCDIKEIEICEKSYSNDDANSTQTSS